MNSRNTRLRWDFLYPPGERRPRWPFGKPPHLAAVKKKIGLSGVPHSGAGDAPYGAVESAAFSGDKKWIRIFFLRCPKFRAPLAPLLGGTYSAPNGSKNFTCAMRIPNMCLVLKLNNGKVVSIANEQDADTQNYRRTEPPSTVLVYRYIHYIIYIYVKYKHI